MFLRLLGVLAVFVSMLSCESREGNTLSRKELKEPLIQENIKITKEEQRLIDRFIERRQWDMEETGTGLHYMIYKEGYGMQAKEGMQATVEYEIKLLDGRVVYSSTDQGPRTFRIGRDNVEPGIHEGVQLMKVGDKAKFVIPSYLGHGISGDNNKIPPRATLIVDLNLLRLN